MLTIPGPYRSQSGRAEYSDDELRSEFKRRALPLLAEGPPRDDWEWYFLMQHYGAPTRLLDWSDSALIALYFAITPLSLRSPATVHSPVVWALNPWALNRKSEIIGPAVLGVDDVDRYLPKVYKAEHPPKYPIALSPTFIAQRMLVQHSQFTLQGDDKRAIEDMTGDLDLKKGLLKVSIEADSESIRAMRLALAMLGITETTIFPDLAGLAKELSLEYEIGL